MTSKISAIVPTYNRAALLPDTIHSIVAQTRPVHEIIIWDDGSTDGTSDVVAALQRDLADNGASEIHYHKSENGGKSRALNLALKEAVGDYIWICDDDDIGMPYATELMAGMLDQDKALFAAGGCYKRFSTDPNTQERIEQGPGYWPDLRTGSPLRHLLEDIFLFQNATLVRKSAFDAVGPFRESLARSIDYDMVVRLACGGPIKIVEDTIFLQRKHDGDRGPAAARHAAAKSEAAWKVADQDVFSPFRQAIPLSIYEAMFDSPDATLIKRAAMLQRACVYARRTDWTAAVEDFETAAGLLPDHGLTAVEVAICRRALAGKHGCAEAWVPQTRAKLRSIATSTIAGSSIGKALARGIMWRAREAVTEKKYSEAASIVGFMAALTTSPRTFKSGRQTGSLIERDHLALSSYHIIVDDSGRPFR